MRLLNTKTYELEEFVGRADTPQYAILSHTWNKEEVSFQDMTSGIGPTKQGWSKIAGFCRRAARVGWQYVWIDCVCIDKRSSAELSESINSMFRWYELASVCYAYLEDVNASSPTLKEEFRKSRWFTRGWTLQELLAPTFVFFVDKSWKGVGTRDTRAEDILHATDMKMPDLLGSFMSCNVATKFRWASRRVTTREEDEAYCLLGLFGINMPLLYGEGRKAFIRLQFEIMKISDDESIFAWQTSTPRTGNGARILAPSPRHFTIPNIEVLGQPVGRAFHIGNQGLQTSNWDLYEWNPEHSADKSLDATAFSRFMAPLKCAVRKGSTLRCLAIALSTHHELTRNEFWKTHTMELETFPDGELEPHSTQWRKVELTQFLVRPTLREFTSQPSSRLLTYDINIVWTQNPFGAVPESGNQGQEAHVEVPHGREIKVDVRCQTKGDHIYTNLTWFRVTISARDRTPSISIRELTKTGTPSAQSLELTGGMGRVDVKLRPSPTSCGDPTRRGIVAAITGTFHNEVEATILPGNAGFRSIKQNLGLAQKLTSAVGSKKRPLNVAYVPTVLPCAPRADSFSTKRIKLLEKKD